MFGAVLTFDEKQRTRLAWIFLGLVFASVLLGAAQLLSGSTALYPWRTTAAGNFAGFMANRNHLATVLLVSLPFAAVCATLARNKYGPHTHWITASGFALILIAIAATKSRFGIILAVPTLFASLLIGWMGTGRRVPSFRLLIFGAAGCVLSVVVVAVASGAILDRFDSSTTEDERFERWPYVLEAAGNYLPVGSGLGSFDPVFRSVEPLNDLGPKFFNQAHNEYLELWLETGWIGLVLASLAWLWWARRSKLVWEGRPSPDALIRRAASVAVAVVFIHSAVDYPLRTEAIAVILALFAAILEGKLTPAPSIRRPL
jgi:O-antigen ligase